MPYTKDQARTHVTELVAQFRREEAALLDKETASISILNDLLKEAEFYDVAQWRKVQWMGDVRNSCDHPTKKEPKKQDVDDLIIEAKKFVALFVV